MLILLSPTLVFSEEFPKSDTIDIQIDIEENRIVKETIKVEFSKFSFIDKHIDFPLDVIPEKILVYGSNETDIFNYSLNITPGKTYLQIEADKIFVKSLTIELTYNNTIFSQEDSNLFFIEHNFSKFSSNKTNAVLNLPENHNIENYYIKPESGIIIPTQGNTFQIKWQNIDLKKPTIFSAKYKKRSINDSTQNIIVIENNKDNSIYFYGFFILLIVILVTIGFFFYKYKPTKKIKDENLLGFREDEKKVINYIQDKKHLMQKEIEKEFNFSRAKCTRIIKKLEENNLIEKEEFGRTNKIHWKK